MQHSPTPPVGTEPWGFSSMRYSKRGRANFGPSSGSFHGETLARLQITDQVGTRAYLADGLASPNTVRELPSSPLGEQASEQREAAEH